MPKTTLTRQAGSGLIEVLVSMLVSSLGLMGLAALLIEGQQAELEAFQRTQALTLVQDMANRINLNRQAAGCYAVTDPAAHQPVLGTGTLDTYDYTCAGWGTTAMRTRAEADIEQWNDLLKGKGESLEGSAVGAMIGARGCVYYDSATRTYTVAVVWQGMEATVAPDNPCGKGLYGDEKLRRVVAVTGEMASRN